MRFVVRVGTRDPFDVTVCKCRIPAQFRIGKRQRRAGWNWKITLAAVVSNRKQVRADVVIPKPVPVVDRAEIFFDQPHSADPANHGSDGCW